MAACVLRVDVFLYINYLLMKASFGTVMPITLTLCKPLQFIITAWGYDCGTCGNVQVSIMQRVLLIVRARLALVVLLSKATFRSTMYMSSLSLAVTSLAFVAGCECATAGTFGDLGCDPRNGQCSCKRYVTGRLCDRCAVSTRTR